MRRAELADILLANFRNNLLDSANSGTLEPYFRRVENLEISPYEAAELIVRLDLLKNLLNPTE